MDAPISGILEQFGWKQRRYAILAAGIFEQLEEESMDEFEKGKNQVCHFYREAGDFSGSVCSSATG